MGEGLMTPSCSKTRFKTTNTQKSKEFIQETKTSTIQNLTSTSSNTSSNNNSQSNPLKYQKFKKHKTVILNLLFSLYTLYIHKLPTLPKG